jgi:hypothetical protein
MHGHEQSVSSLTASLKYLLLIGGMKLNLALLMVKE